MEQKHPYHEIQKERNYWRWLVNVWTVFTLLVFIIDFTTLNKTQVAARCAIGIIYIAILGIYVGTKEFDRWATDKYLSQYLGEFFVVLWTIIILLMAVLTILNKNLIIPPDISTVYITVLSIFAISRRSRYLYHRKNRNS